MKKLTVILCLGLIGLFVCACGKEEKPVRQDIYDSTLVIINHAQEFIDDNYDLTTLENECQKFQDDFLSYKDTTEREMKVDQYVGAILGQAKNNDDENLQSKVNDMKALIGYDEE